MNFSNKSGTVLKTTLASLAVLNLAALFLFDYSLPGRSKKQASEDSYFSVTSPEPSASETEAAEGETTPQDASAAGWKITFSPEELSYDGEGDLDLMTGVSLLQPDGSVSELPLYVFIKTGATLNEKLVSYSVDTPDGNLTAERSLQLAGYEGPSLSIPSSMPSLPMDALDTLHSVLYEDDDYFATDGFGNYITSAITIDLSMPQSGNLVDCTFTVTNMFNDKASASAVMEVTLTRPVISLRSTEVTITVGNPFNELDYLTGALDVDGADLTSLVSVRGVVDTMTPGDYTLIYALTSPSGEEAQSKNLLVHVTE